MKFVVKTPYGNGLLVKAFHKRGIKYARVSLNPTYTINKRGKKVLNRTNNVRDFLYADCTIHKAQSRFSRFLKSLFKRK